MEESGPKFANRDTRAFTKGTESGQITGTSSDNFMQITHDLKDSFLTEKDISIIQTDKKTVTGLRRVTHSFREGSSMGTVITLVMTAAVGPGVLSLSYAVAASGWALSLAQMIACAFMCNFSLVLMTKVGKVTGKHSYANIAESLYPGKFFPFFVRITFFANNWGAAVADLILVKDLIIRCLLNLNLTMLPDFFTDSRSNFWPVFLGAFIGFPLCLKRSFKELRVVMITGFVLVVYVISVIFKEYVQSDIKKEWSAATAFDPKGIFTTLPIIFFSFACHPVVLDGYKELEAPTERKYRRVLSKTMLVLLIFYTAIGFFGYLRFTREDFKLAEGNILLAYNPNDISIDLAILFFALTMTFSLPLGLKPVKGVLSELVGVRNEEEESLKKHVFLTALTVGSVIACSVLVSNMTLVVNFLGASFNALIVFNLPCMYYMRLVNKRGKKKRLTYYVAYIMNISLFIFSAFSIGYLVYCQMNGITPVGG